MSAQSFSNNVSSGIKILEVDKEMFITLGYNFRS